jgi:hypothetical protein
MTRAGRAVSREARQARQVKPERIAGLGLNRMACLWPTIHPLTLSWSKGRHKLSAGQGSACLRVHGVLRANPVFSAVAEPRP